MNRISMWSILVVFVMAFVGGCGGKTTSLEGKVVDGKGQPLTNVKVAAKMSQPIKGYEQFETTTGSDGAFTFKKLFPTSEYQLIFYSDRWMTEVKSKTDSGLEGQIKNLQEPITIRFMDSKKDVILDSKTNLMWAAQDNGHGINWSEAKKFCENYREGGYTDWRMPTQAELAELYASANYKNSIKLNHVVWASDTRKSEAATFDFHYGGPNWSHQSSYQDIFFSWRALPVRSTK